MRSFGTEISANERSKAELSPEMHFSVITSLENAKSPSKLAKESCVSRSTIYYTKKSFESNKTLKSPPRSGRPHKLSPAAKRYIYQTVRRRPHTTWKALVAGTLPGVSKTTI